MNGVLFGKTHSFTLSHAHYEISMLDSSTLWLHDLHLCIQLWIYAPCTLCIIFGTLLTMKFLLPYSVLSNVTNYLIRGYLMAI